MYNRFLQILPGERLLLFMLLSLIFVVYGGCAAIIKEKRPEEIITPALQWDVKNYADFLKQKCFLKHYDALLHYHGLIKFFRASELSFQT